jgi:hypothetical protein
MAISTSIYVFTHNGYYSMVTNSKSIIWSINARNSLFIPNITEFVLGAKTLLSLCTRIYVLTSVGKTFVFHWFLLFRFNQNEYLNLFP